MAGRFIADLSVPTELSMLPVIRRYVTSLASSLGYSIEQVDELGIAITEASLSVITRSQAWWGGSGMLRIRCTTTDSNCCFELALKPSSRDIQIPEPEIDPLAIMGMDLARCLVDSMKVHPRVKHGQIRILLTTRRASG